MTERSTINQIVQLGVEATPGTGVAATKRLSSLMVEPSVKTDIQTYRPSGGKYTTVTALGKEWNASKITGPGTYTELIYVLAGMYGFTAPAQIGTTGGYTWAFNPQSNGADSYKTYTIEKGSSDGSGAEKSSYNVLTDWGYKFDRGSFDVNGAMIGQAIQTGITMSAGTTALDLIPILPTQVDVYLETSSAALGTPTNKLTRFMSGEFSHASAKGPVWVMDSSQTSYVAIVETVPKVDFKIELEADAQGLGLLSTMRAGTTAYIQVVAKGANIGTSADYTFKHNMAVKVSDVQDFKDKDGVYAIGFNFEVVTDPNWSTGQAHNITMVNKLQTL